MKKKRVSKKKVEVVKKNHFDHYIHSTKLDKSFFMTVIFDFAYCISVFALLLCILWGVSAVLLPVASALQSITALFTSANITPTVELTLDENFNVIKWFYLKSALLFFGGIFTLFAITATYKAFIWVHLTKQRLTTKFFVQFFKVNIIWQFLWLLLATITFFLFDVVFATYLLLTELFLYMYFTPFLRAIFTEKITIKKIFRQTFVAGVKNLPKFLIPIVLMIITVIFVMWFVAMLLQFIAPLGMFLLAIVFVFVTISWVRFYFSIVAKHLVN
ncbi:hypothetical protein COV16_06800 [Candidatus Woesearchaeota archaeon CG10_big_fil_rev_8_21_14_0_10_34_8]|nr:MAG: hypothetical protein COV16_06800 [Candidatus Woesearchaeota archaeon CG10_big_fil_rev_8_21_14_0_10_34_8]